MRENLPEQLRTLRILPRHRVLLTHQVVDGKMWVVLLTRMPGKCDCAWVMSVGEYWSLNPKHGTRDRFVRENFPPTFKGKPNPIQLTF